MCCTSVPWKYFETMYLLQIYDLAHIIVGLWLQCRAVHPQGLALLTLSLDKNWDRHSPMNGYPSFYPRIALVAPSPGHICVYWHKQEKHYFYMIITGNITVFLFAMSPIRFQSYLLTLKRLGHFFQNVILFSNVVHHKCNIFIWNWTDTMNVWSALWMLMAWCCSTRASVATVLTTHPCVSRCLWVKQLRHTDVYRRMIAWISIAKMFSRKKIKILLRKLKHPISRTRVLPFYNVGSSCVLGMQMYEHMHGFRSARGHFKNAYKLAFNSWW